MTTAAEFIGDALESAGVVGIGEGGAPPEIQAKAFRLLNEILSFWRAKEIPVYPLADYGDDMPDGDGYEYALKLTLVEELCGMFRSPIPQGLPIKAAAARDAVFRLVAPQEVLETELTYGQRAI